MGIMII
jgi:hypothetical protein